MRTVILSTNDNPDYLKYYPYVSWAWNQLGWNTLCFYHGKDTALLNEFKEVRSHFDANKNLIQRVGNIEGYRSETIVQVARLFGGICYPDDRMLMIGDGDMIPLSGYWTPEPGKITTYGWDLTNQGHFPMCYIAMPADKWRDIMGIPKAIKSVEHEIKRILDKTPKAKSNVWEEWWQVDQDIITELLLQCSRTDVVRGTDNGLAYGRADRYNWEGTKDKGSIDAHMPRPFDLEATKYILQKAFGKLPGWIQ